MLKTERTQNYCSVSVTEEKKKRIAAIFCHHCGLPALESIRREENFFCCQGCLSASVMQEESACIIPDTVRNEDLSWTDLPGALNQFEEGRMGDAVLYRFRLPAVHCAACIQVLENLHLRNPGILYSEVLFLSREIRIAWNSSLMKASDVFHLLGRLGYLPDFSSRLSWDGKEGKRQPDLLLRRLALAAFCSGNIMLFSFPEYLGLEDTSYRHIFSWLNLSLAIPAAVYSGQPWWNALWLSLRNRELNLDVPIAIGMLATFSLSVYEILSGNGPGYFDSLTGLIFLLLAGKWIQGQTFRQLSFERDYKSWLPLAVQRIQDGVESPVLSPEIMPGDVLRIRHQEIVPCDGILLSDAASFDNSFITGESDAVHFCKGDSIRAGSRNISSGILMKAGTSLKQSRLVQLWNNPLFEKEKKPGLESFGKKVAVYFTPGVLLLAFFTGLYWFQYSTSLSLRTFVSVLIVACPCTLALAYPIAMGNTMRIWGKRGFFIKNHSVVEILGKLQVLVFDKTGTLGDGVSEEVVYFGKELSPQQKSKVAALASCSTHPLSRSISSFLSGGNAETAENYTELTGKGISAVFGREKIKLGSAVWLGTESNGTGGPEVVLSIAGEVYGSFIFRSRKKPFTDSLISQLKNRYRLAMISGDSEKPSESWKELFEPSGGICLFEQSPEDKLKVLEGLKDSGLLTCMIGDGLNDAGALRSADCGIALATGHHQFGPDSDAILPENELPAIPKILKEAGRSILVVKICFAVSLLYNLIGFIVAAGGMISPLWAAVLMPASSLTVAGIAWLGTSIISTGRTSNNKKGSV
jgi:Cu+-exporting ATPase